MIMTFPSEEDFAKKVAEKALDEIIYNGKTIREWINELAKWAPCEDAISRQAVWDVLKELWGTNCELIDRLMTLPPVTPAPNWISCSERLPEYGTEVLTCSSGGYIEIQSIEGTYSYWENQKGDWSDIDEVIAWMPLPEPCKAESEE